ncbi:bacterial regulatory helix-turn-helix, lysR family protein [Acinetobacter sp. 1245593]|nr:bacterial regulatory helix-turn-helix, lysR family protein [Acinetobacter sp. 1245593]
MQKKLKQITSFLQVVDSGSFTKAAEILGLSRSMVSIDIKQLEKQLNTSRSCSTRLFSLFKNGFDCGFYRIFRVL